ncbi:MAG TPA: ABC transporter permease subunit [Pseudomonadales bacterium]|nr:ABC transporter permease subunit [Pseudomonadales bacterium]
MRAVRALKAPRLPRAALVAVTAFAYAFLYVPIVLLVLYSFNDSRLVTIWGGFSLRWYRELFANDALLDAAWLSLRIALTSATLATALGLLAALLLARVRGGLAPRFVGAAVGALLVMPDILLGVAFLLLFVSLEQWLGWPAGRGVTTVTLAHVTFTIAYVAIVVRARMSQLDPDIEAAARDLGASPTAAFLLVTVPQLTPALLSGWLLAFTLSLDDLVVASFASGPGASTLPMVVYSSVRLGVTPQINALATILVGIVATGVLVAAVWIGRRKAGRA